MIPLLEGGGGAGLRYLAHVLIHNDESNVRRIPEIVNEYTEQQKGKIEQIYHIIMNRIEVSNRSNTTRLPGKPLDISN